MTNYIKKSALLGVIGVFLFTNVLFVPAVAQAELSSETKNTLKSVIEDNNSISGLSEIITYLYTIFNGASRIAANSSSGTSANTANTTTSTDRLLCGYVYGLTKNLQEGSVDSQVTTLQKFLNTLATKDSAYQEVAASGPGSVGNETTYFGRATEFALSRWQQKNLPSASMGELDSATRAKLNTVYCGPVIARATGNTQTGTSGSGSQSSTNQTGTNTSGTSGTGAGATSPSVGNSVNLSKPELSFNKTSVNKGDRVTYDVDLRNNPIDGCRLNTKFVNQNQTRDNIVFSKNSGSYADYPQLTTEYFISCTASGQTVESDHTTVVVDGVTPGAGVGTGSQSISVQGANGETPWYTMSGGEYRYFFHVDANVASDATVRIYYGASNASCTSLSNQVSTTNSLTNTYIATIAESLLQSGKTYYFCAAAVTSSGAVAAETPVGSFVTK